MEAIIAGLVTVHTGVGKKAPARFRECFRQVQAEVVSKSSNKFHQTWGPPFSPVLYFGNPDPMQSKVQEREVLCKRMLTSVCFHGHIFKTGKLFSKIQGDADGLAGGSG